MVQLLLSEVKDLCRAWYSLRFVDIFNIIEQEQRRYDSFFILTLTPTTGGGLDCNGRVTASIKVLTNIRPLHVRQRTVKVLHRRL